MLLRMLRFRLMSRLGLAEPVVRLARSIESSNRRAASKQIVSNHGLVAQPPGDMVALRDQPPAQLADAAIGR